MLSVRLDDDNEFILEAIKHNLVVQCCAGWQRLAVYNFDDK